jgi:hypothetical protein
MKHSPPEQLVGDLFDRGEPVYPAFPGAAKGSETSREAAEAIAPAASSWRGKVARLYAEKFPGDFTADEAARELNATPFMIRPRVTELGAAGLIQRTGERRRNPDSTLNAAVWRAAPLLLGNNPAPSIAPGDGLDVGRAAK